MIVSHRHKFIFVHLGRTGGRSLTEALARHCGPEDIITWTSGQVPARNAASFWRHDSAAVIRAKVGERVWNEYFKFTFERNPWEKIVSRYWDYACGRSPKFYKQVWQRAFGRPLSFSEWFRLRIWQGRLFGLGHIRLPAHYHDYTERGRILVDFIGRCENRAAHVALLSERLGIEIRDDLRHGAEFHRDRKPYTELFDPWMQRIVERVFRRDLDLLGYRFGQPHPTNALWIEEGRSVAAASSRRIRGQDAPATSAARLVC
jgi:hypothetical protein